MKLKYASKPERMLPFYIDFAITYNCNAKCQHCSINAEYYTDKNHKSEMDTEKIFKLIDQFDEIGILFIGLTGGEAILRPDIWKIIDYCHAKRMLVAIASNGIGLSQNIIDKLILHKVDSIFISLDHYNSNQHDKIRGESNIFYRAITSIQNCVSNSIPVTVGITPMKDNYQEVDKIIDYAIELGARAINISNFVPTGRGSKDMDLTPIQWKELFFKLQECSKKYKDKIRLQIHDVKLGIFYDDVQSFSLKTYHGCLAGYTHCYILPNGDVYPCVMLPIKLGNVLETSLREILFEYQSSSNIIDKNKLLGKCGDCSQKYKCGGCRATAYAYTNNANEADPHCWINDNTIDNFIS